MRKTLLLTLLLLPWASSSADDFTSSPPCRGYRAKRQEVPIFREADRSSEVLGKLERSEEVCGLGETREFVSILWPKLGQPAAAQTAAQLPTLQASPQPSVVGTPFPQAFVRTVDLWPPRGEFDPNRNPLKDWWLMRQNGIVPDDPFAFFRALLPFFDNSPQNTPSPGGTP